MAMGGRGRREAENAIASCRPFKNSTGSFYGTRGSTRDLGWLSSHADARRIRKLLSRAVYVVWSYNTPISWVTEDEDGGRTAYYVDESHSMTTSHHQSIARMGMGEYETIGTRRPVRRPRRQPLSVVGQREAEAAMAFASGTLAPDFPGAASAARRYRDMDAMASLIERERQLQDAEADRPSDVFVNGVNETEQARNLARLLDARFADPNWTPFRDEYRASNLHEGAEARDHDRVEREGEWRP